MARVLLINPSIYDFAAYDLWARPLGLLYVAAALERFGHEVRLVDCLDRLHPSVRDIGGKRGPRSRHYGTGSYYWREADKPAVYEGVARIYKRFGLPEEVMRQDIASGLRPDIIGVTSAMTYWYPGVVEAVRIAREAWPGAPVALGGVYATLCANHAQRAIGPDILVKGAGEDEFARIVAQAAGGPAPNDETPFAQLADPAYHLLARLESVAVLTGRGCPFRCAYCASHTLAPMLERRPVEAVVDEIERYRRDRGIADVAFYDDALLWEPERHAKPLLREVIRRDMGVRFHTPNGLHARMIDEELARLMREAGFVTIRLSLETVSRERGAEWDNKVQYEEFLAAVANLKRAGFPTEQLGGYVMAGVPGEEPDEALRAIAAVHAAGVPVRLAEYSPIPGTPDFERARAATRLDLDEPLLQNNTIVPIGGAEGFARHQMLKSVAQRLNDALAAGKMVVARRDVEGKARAALEREGIL